MDKHLSRRIIKQVDDAKNEREAVEHPHGDGVRKNKSAYGKRNESGCRLRDEEYIPFRIPVGRNAPERAADKLREKTERQHDAQLRTRAREREHEPAERDDLHPRPYL